MELQKQPEESKDQFRNTSQSQNFKESLRMSGTNMYQNKQETLYQSQSKFGSSQNNMKDVSKQYNQGEYQNNNYTGSQKMSQHQNTQKFNNSGNNNMYIQEDGGHGQQNNLSQSKNFHRQNEESIVNYNQTGSQFIMSDAAQTIVRKSSDLSKMNEKNPIKMTLSTQKQPDPMINNNGVREDDRYTAYNIELPVDYYLNFVKTNEPPSDKPWYVRPHHIESFVKNERAIADDVMNTKYISYYSPPEIQHPITRQEQLDEVIGKLETNIDSLKKDFYVSMNKNSNGKKKYDELEKMQEEIKKNYKPGQVYDEMNREKQKNTIGLMKDNAGYSELFDKNENVHQTNLVIKTYETLLEELRGKEKDILVRKRKEELEKIRPPSDKWWEKKSQHFQNELKRNRIFINASPKYFEKLSELQDNNLF